MTCCIPVDSHSIPQAEVMEYPKLYMGDEPCTLWMMIPQEYSSYVTYCIWVMNYVLPGMYIHAEPGLMESSLPTERSDSMHSESWP